MGGKSSHFDFCGVNFDTMKLFHYANMAVAHMLQGFWDIEKARWFRIKTIALIWRRRWDSNPRGVAAYLISSQGRYDHFDTYPWTRFTNAQMIITNPAKKIKYGGGISANSVV